MESNEIVKANRALVLAVCSVVLVGIGWLVDVWLPSSYLGMAIICLGIAASVPAWIYGMATRRTWQGRVSICVSAVILVMCVLSAALYTCASEEPPETISVKGNDYGEK
jgi:hypothetical protein